MGGSPEEEVVDGHFLPITLQDPIDPLSSLQNPTHVHRDAKEEVGYGTEGFDQPLGDGLPHLRERKILEIHRRDLATVPDEDNAPSIR